MRVLSGVEEGWREGERLDGPSPSAGSLHSPRTRSSERSGFPAPPLVVLRGLHCFPIELRSHVA